MDQYLWMHYWGQFLTSNLHSLALQPNPLPFGYHQNWFLSTDQSQRGCTSCPPASNPNLKLQHKQELAETPRSHLSTCSNLQGQVEMLDEHNPPSSQFHRRSSHKPEGSGLTQPLNHPKRTHPELSGELSDEQSLYSDQRDLPAQEGPRKRTSWKPKHSRRETFLLFRKILEDELPLQSEKQYIKHFQAELSQRIRKDIAETYGKYSDQLLSSELVFAKKNITAHLLKILQLAFGAMRTDTTIYRPQPLLDYMNEELTKCHPRISDLLGLYRQPQFQTFVEFLKRRVFHPNRLAALIMVLNIKPTEKLVMLPLIPSFIRALHHPTEEIRLWRSDDDISNKRFSEIAEDVVINGLSYEDVLAQLTQMQHRQFISKPQKQCRSKFNNLSYRFKNMLSKIAAEAYELCDSAEGKAELEVLRSHNRVLTSIEGVRQLLRCAPLKSYLIQKYVSTKRLMAAILEDSSLDIRSKLSMLECYPKLLKALEDPQSLKGWDSSDL